MEAWKFNFQPEKMPSSSCKSQSAFEINLRLLNDVARTKDREASLYSKTQLFILRDAVRHIIIILYYDAVYLQAFKRRHKLSLKKADKLIIHNRNRRDRRYSEIEKIKDNFLQDNFIFGRNKSCHTLSYEKNLYLGIFHWRCSDCGQCI